MSDILPTSPESQPETETAPESADKATGPSGSVGPIGPIGPVGIAGVSGPDDSALAGPAGPAEFPHPGVSGDMFPMAPEETMRGTVIPSFGTPSGTASQVVAEEAERDPIHHNNFVRDLISKEIQRLRALEASPGLLKLEHAVAGFFHKL